MLMVLGLLVDVERSMHASVRLPDAERPMTVWTANE